MTAPATIAYRAYIAAQKAATTVEGARTLLTAANATDRARYHANVAEIAAPGTDHARNARKQAEIAQDRYDSWTLATSHACRARWAEGRA